MQSLLLLLVFVFVTLLCNNFRATSKSGCSYKQLQASVVIPEDRAPEGATFEGDKVKIESLGTEVKPRKVPQEQRLSLDSDRRVQQPLSHIELRILSSLQSQVQHERVAKLLRDVLAPDKRGTVDPGSVDQVTSGEGSSVDQKSADEFHRTGEVDLSSKPKPLDKGAAQQNRSADDHFSNQIIVVEEHHEGVCAFVRTPICECVCASVRRSRALCISGGGLDCMNA